MVIIISFYGCSKENGLTPGIKQTHTISIIPAIKGLSSTAPAIGNSPEWTHVIGKVNFEFTPAGDNTWEISAVRDSIDFRTAPAFSRDLIAGTYDLNTTSAGTSAADTFIRFSSELKSYLIDKDQAIKLPVTTGDGLILISKDYVKSGERPAIRIAESDATFNFGISQDCYFLYVAEGTKGMISFTEASTGDLYLYNVSVNGLTTLRLIPKIDMKKSFSFINQPF